MLLSSLLSRKPGAKNEEDEDEPMEKNMTGDAKEDDDSEESDADGSKRKHLEDVGDMVRKVRYNLEKPAKTSTMLHLFLTGSHPLKQRADVSIWWTSNSSLGQTFG